jgi:hypothetical protein
MSDLKRNFDGLQQKSSKPEKPQSNRLYGVETFDIQQISNSRVMRSLLNDRYLDRTEGGLISGNLVITGSLTINGSFGGIGLLKTTNDIDLNVAGTHVLFTVPISKTCIISQIIIRNPSVALVGVAFSFGFDATGTDIKANSTYAAVNATTKYTIVEPIAGATNGVAGETLKLYVNTTQAVTLDVDVFGYIF